MIAAFEFQNQIALGESTRQRESRTSSLPCRNSRSAIISIDGSAAAICFAQFDFERRGHAVTRARAACSATAATTSGCACPRISAPHEQT